MGWAVGDGKTIKAWQDPWLSTSRKLQPMGPPTEASHDIVVADLFQANTQDWDLNTIERELPELVDTILKNDWMRIIAIPCLPPVGIITVSLAPWIVWALWTARNSMIFNDKGFTTEQVLTKAIVTAKEWQNAQTREVKQHQPRRQTEPPPCYGVVVQTDAAWIDNSRMAGIGWIIKQAECTQSFQNTSSFVTSQLMAEGLAMRDTIRKCKELGIRRFRCESDSTQLIKALNSKMEPPELYGIIADIRLDCTTFDSVSFIWIPRLTNVDADRLVKQALNLVAVLTKAIVTAKEWQNAQTREVKQHQPRRQTEPPPCYGVVVQTDAAWIDNSRMAGIGWIIKQAECTQSFQNTSSFVTSQLMAEGLAMRDTIRKCKELGIRRFRCESDSTQLIKALNSKMEPPELYGIIADIRLDCTTFDSVSFIWIPRLTNVDADRLVKQALNLVAVPTA
ncbi:hypothetical protein DY000_02020231 [Brassica cretica]|uniref:RNase H type-1 domain-containing protein n=2 Tax=Brassica cretica TaxID=69181 RepID=A0ABQ7EM39_BRACR|nr:hypothetical protein DY000_02020231 [Brassica cretica]